MKSLNEIELELARLGFRNRFFGKPEARELCHILSEGEVMTNVATGRYEGGYAMLLATDRRLLLIDKKIWFLSLEDVRYDMISEIDFHARLLDATVYIRTINKVLRFTSRHQVSLRGLVKQAQERVMELRQQPLNHEQTQSFAPQFATTIPLDPPARPLIARVAQALPAAPQVSVPMRPFRRLGAYPTASFTTHQQVGSGMPTYHRS